MQTRVLIAAVALSGSFAPIAPAQQAAVPDSIAVPAGHAQVAKFAASGVQVYRCKAAAGDAGGYAWTLVGPDATLTDEQGKAAGRHYAGPTWEANDGGKVTGKIVAKAPAPDGSSIPWLLLAATPAADARALSGVAYIQRLQTHGGAAPAGGCSRESLDAETRVAYVAQYLFFAKK
jgi:hypothetical protein